MLNQTFTKAEVHQLAHGLFKDIPFQTEDGKNKMKSALHLYRSGNVYNIERKNEELRATMLADGSKVHIFLNIKTGFYGIHLDENPFTPMQADVIYVTAALLALFASVDSVGAFLDLWKTNHATQQPVYPTNIPTAIGDDYFQPFQQRFVFDYQAQLGANHYPSKEAYFIACNAFIVSATDNLREQGFACGLSFSYIPLYVFVAIMKKSEESSAFNIDLLRDTFARRLLQLAEKELKRLPKDIFQQHEHTDMELHAYTELLNCCVERIDMSQLANLYCELYTFQLKPSWHQKQLEQIGKYPVNPTQQIMSVFHLVEMTHYNEAKKRLQTFPATDFEEKPIRLDWPIFAPFVEHIFHALMADKQFQESADFLWAMHSVFSQQKDADMLESIMQLYMQLAEVPAHQEICISALRRMLPNSLPQLAEIAWQNKNYRDWVSLIMLLPWASWQDYRREIQSLIAGNQAVLFPLLHRLIHHYIEEKNKTSYQSAIYYLRQLKVIYAKNRQLETWQAYYDYLKEQYRNLRSFQGMLQKDIGK